MVQLYIYTTRGCAIASDQECFLVSKKVTLGTMTYFLLYGRPRDPSRPWFWAIELTQRYLVHTTYKNRS